MELADGTYERSEKHPWRDGWSLGEVGRPRAGESEDEEVQMRAAGKRGVDELDVGEGSGIQRAAP